ncbi:MAG: 8-oxo-dGTP diphosphatase [Elusimicrobiota bacterium]|nr:8-oxo-dGTP diphosphatase [Elusimicrobiota bacterium]
MAVLATLCYVRSGGRTLMLHRNKKPGDVHKGKYNGVGGKFEPGESPDDCVQREVKEETGLTLLDARLRGVLTFPAFAKGEDWVVFVYTATRFEGEPGDCAEGTLEWVKDADIASLNLWEGDRVFLPWLDGERFFSAKFVYRDGRLVGHDCVFHG